MLECGHVFMQTNYTKTSNAVKVCLFCFPWLHSQSTLSYSGADVHMRAHIELSEMENMAVPGGV